MPTSNRQTRRARLAGLILLLLAGAAAAEGPLVVAGGAVRADNAEVFGAFIAALPDADGKIAVISAASGSPVQSAESFIETLGRYDVAAERIVPIALAMTDDDETAFDERQWAGNGTDADEIARLFGVAGIWFTGGDQRRIAATLLDDNGGSTPMLDEIRALHAKGAVIGGTSAGAAIMSNPMITGGEPIVALLGDVASGEPLTMGAGLGFFPIGLVDQHFDARARLGRVAVALGALQSRYRFAVGVDENTAFVYTPGNASIRIVGSGSATLVDGRNADFRRIDGRVSIEGLTVSVLSPGDRFSLADGDYQPARYLEPTVGNEYYDREAVSGGGIALPSTGLSRMLGEELLDNRGSRATERVTVVTQPDTHASAAAGVLFRFRQTDDSLGFWGRDTDGRSRYSVIDVGFDIEPLSVRIDPIPDLEQTAND